MAENPRLIRAERGIRRRLFLKALALGLSVPLAAKLSKLSLAQSGPVPKRFLLYYMPHGIAPEHYNPRVAESDRTTFSLDQTNVSTLGPLEAYKQYVNVYQGFKYTLANTHDGVVNCLSGVSTSDTTTPRTTLEQIIARGLNKKALVLGACSHIPYQLDKNGMLFWDGTPIDPEKSPVAAADRLFGGGGATTPTNHDVELRKDLLTLTAAEVQGLQSELSGLTKEQTKLQTHLKAIQAIQAQGSMTTSSACMGRPAMPSVELVRAASAGLVVDPSGGNDYFYQEKNFPLIFQAQLEVASQALLCGAAQVVALMPLYTTCDFDFTFADAPGTHHNGLSHSRYERASGAMDNSPPSIDNLEPAARAAFARAQRWFATQLEKTILEVLMQDDPLAPGTKVIDNSLVYWMSEIGDGADHTNMSKVLSPPAPSYLPLVTIGKAGGALKTGQVIRFDTDRPAGDLYATLARAMGVSSTAFPDGNAPVIEALT